jgi:BirA family transcriptional regulator, biotin operon repressor / biotin---[acetyl-CoA-carboxylase] ligase
MKVYVIKQCDSSNREVFRHREWLENKQPFVLFCHDQKKGRGYSGNFWHADPGKNLTCSMVFSPSFLEAHRQFYFSMIIALSIDDLMKNYGLKSLVKWPNDILVENKKIGGILIESEIQQENINCIVAGIGLNVNQKKFQSNIKNPTSLILAGIEKETPESVLKKLIDHVEYWYHKLKNHAFNTIKSTYLDRLTGYQSWKTYRSGKKVFKAKIIDICEDGKARMESENGTVHEFDIKEVEWVK